jgi:hypothetical protein
MPRFISATVRYARLSPEISILGAGRQVNDQDHTMHEGVNAAMNPLRNACGTQAFLIR